MSLIQILDCSEALGTCCSDYGLVTVLDSCRKILNLIQLVAPIILIIWSCVGLISLIINPEEKKLKKSLINKYLAAVLCFFIPVIIDAMLGLMPETFSVSACWKQAQVSAEIVRSLRNEYISEKDKTQSPILLNPDEYEPGDEREEPVVGSSNSVSGGSGAGSQKGKEIVKYARSFVGQRYVWGGFWNGELPYTGTDCSGFVQGIFAHHGISLGRDTTSQWADKSKFSIVEGEIKAGDLVMYSEHVGILTGNGNEIIHAKGTNYGIVIDPDYKTCSSKAILGIMRINGVN